jgi:para-nitrobenzyl esterase
VLWHPFIKRATTGPAIHALECVSCAERCIGVKKNGGSMLNRPCCSKVKIGTLFFAVTLAAAIIAGSVAMNAANEKGPGPSANALLADPIKTDAGYVSGTIVGDVGKEVRVYRGIPYAAPPVKDLRWKPPQPVTPWKGIKECTKFGPYATQYTWTGAWMSEMQEAGMSEDCLHLNVHTPAKTAKNKLPVIVWLHDGGLDAGSGNRPVYNYPYLPQHGVVLVTVSHRIGGMGFFAHPGLSAESPSHATGNYGMLDIVAALKWLQQNIAAFGGDPSRVTIMGQSGGGTKVMWLLTSPLAKGLFHRAIIEGGVSGAEGVSGLKRDVHTQAEAEVQGEKIAAKLGAKNIAELRAMSWKDILKVVPPPQTRPDNELKMRFTVDGWSTPDRPFNISSKGLGAPVPIMIGGGEVETAVHQGTALWAPGLIKANPNLFVYVFSHLPTNWKEVAELKAYHGLELFYQFGGLAAVSETGVWPPPSPAFPKDPGLDKNDEVMTENIMKMWVQFAATGNPSVVGIAKWPAFKTTAGEDKYLNIAVPSEVKTGFMEKYKQ